MSEKPFWEGKTLMEIQNLDKRVKVTMENGDVFIGKLVRRSRDADGMCSLSMQLDAHRTYLHVFSAESFHPDYIPEDFRELLRMACDSVWEQGELYSEDLLLAAFKPAIDEHDRQIAEQAWENGLN